MTLGYTVFGRDLLTLPPYKPSLPWIGGDLQTIRNTLIPEAVYFEPKQQERLSFAMQDGSGDQLLALLDRPEQDKSLPLLILIHGLTGCEGSHNIMISARHFLSLGFPVLRLNLRGAGPLSDTANTTTMRVDQKT